MSSRVAKLGAEVQDGTRGSLSPLGPGTVGIDLRQRVVIEESVLMIDEHSSLNLSFASEPADPASYLPDPDASRSGVGFERGGRALYGRCRTGHAVHVIDPGSLGGTRANCGAILDQTFPAQTSLQTLGLFGLIPCANCAAILPLRRYKAARS